MLTQGSKTFWQIFEVGSSNSVIGIYKIIAALHWLMSWAEEDYRPWFERNMVPLTREEKVTFGFRAPTEEAASEGVPTLGAVEKTSSVAE